MKYLNAIFGLLAFSIDCRAKLLEPLQIGPCSPLNGMGFLDAIPWGFSPESPGRFLFAEMEAATQMSLPRRSKRRSDSHHYSTKCVLPNHVEIMFKCPEQTHRNLIHFGYLQEQGICEKIIIFTKNREFFKRIAILTWFSGLYFLKLSPFCGYLSNFFINLYKTFCN